MTAQRRIFATARPSLIGAPVLPMDPHERWVLDEIRRRRAGQASTVRKPA